MTTDESPSDYDRWVNMIIHGKPTASTARHADSVKQCTDWRDERARSNWSKLGPRKGQKQVQCMACGRWCYVEDRCNLFTTVKVPA